MDKIRRELMIPEFNALVTHNGMSVYAAGFLGHILIASQLSYYKEP